MLRALVLCVLAAYATAGTPAELASRMHAAIMSGKAPLVQAPAGTLGVFVAMSTYSDSACTTITGTSFAQSGTCVTTGQQFSGSFGQAGAVPGSVNLTLSGSTLTGCVDYGSFTCSSQNSACIPYGTTACTLSGTNVYSMVSTSSYTFVSSTGYNGTSCSGLPAGPSFSALNQCLVGTSQYTGSPNSAKLTAGYTQCNYTDTTCTTQNYCITCQPGACCTDSSAPGQSFKIGAASAVAPSLLVLAAAALAALSF